jgi:tetratricopeptide (TPR) repeat protein
MPVRRIYSFTGTRLVLHLWQRLVVALLLMPVQAHAGGSYLWQLPCNQLVEYDEDTGAVPLVRIRNNEQGNSPRTMIAVFSDGRVIWSEHYKDIDKPFRTRWGDPGFNHETDDSNGTYYEAIVPAKEIRWYVQRLKKLGVTANPGKDPDIMASPLRIEVCLGDRFARWTSTHPRVEFSGNKFYSSKGRIEISSPEEKARLLSQEPEEYQRFRLVWDTIWDGACALVEKAKAHAVTPIGTKLALGTIEVQPEPALDGFLIPDAATVLEKLEPDAGTAAVLAEADGLAKAQAHAGAQERLEQALPAAVEDQKGLIVAKQGYLALAAKDDEAAIRAFRRIAEQDILSDDDTLCDAVMRLGFLNIRTKNREEALRWFTEVAYGRVPADNAQASEAATRVGTLQRLNGKPDLAIAAFEAVYTNAADPAKVDYARLQVAGLLWEKGKGDYGTVPDEEAKALFARSQEQCRILMERPEATAETRAIAELIFLEDDYFMGQYESAYTRAGAYMEKWGKVKAEGRTGAWNPDRQLSTCHAFRMVSAFQTSRLDEVLSIVAEIEGGRWKDSDPYPNLDIRAYAALYKSYTLEVQGHAEEARAIREKLKAENPQFMEVVGTKHAKFLKRKLEEQPR